MSKFVSFKYFSFPFPLLCALPRAPRQFACFFFLSYVVSFRFIFASQWHFLWNVYYNAYDTVSMLYYVVFNFVLNARCSMLVARSTLLYFLALLIRIRVADDFTICSLYFEHKLVVRWNSYSVIIFFFFGSRRHTISIHTINSDTFLLVHFSQFSHFVIGPLLVGFDAVAFFFFFSFLLLSASAIFASILCIVFPK